MPLFDEKQIRDLLGEHASADCEVDLRGMSLAQARIAIERMLERRRFIGPTTVVIWIDPATPTSGETLFLPIGRQPLEARRQKHSVALHHCRTVMVGAFVSSCWVIRDHNSYPDRSFPD